MKFRLLVTSADILTEVLTILLTHLIHGIMISGISASWCSNMEVIRWVMTRPGKGTWDGTVQFYVPVDPARFGAVPCRLNRPVSRVEFNYDSCTMCVRNSIGVLLVCALVS